MRELLRSNDLVHLSWAQAALSAAGIESVVLDAHVSGVEGNIGAFPRRLGPGQMDEVVAAQQFPHGLCILYGA